MVLKSGDPVKVSYKGGDAGYTWAKSIVKRNE
jgi:hypothetical protein